MKLLLSTLLLTLFSFTSYAQTTWPHNPKTGKVEFRGALAWPKDTRTEAQRQALVRRWYLGKLTVLSPAAVEAQAATNQNNGLLTYAGLPKATGLRYGMGDDAYLLGYFVQFSPTSSVLEYTFTRFNLGRAGDVETTDATPLEQLLPKATPNEQAALATLRKRLAVAVSGW